MSTLNLRPRRKSESRRENMTMSRGERKKERRKERKKKKERKYLNELKNNSS
jgi:hypothetical protein